MEKLSTKKTDIHKNGQAVMEQERIAVLKTYKIYIGGSFPRTESGRFYTPKNEKGEALANICLCSRKDFKNAVVASRKAFDSWAGKTAFNRSQILYRIAEVLEDRKPLFESELIRQGLSKKDASMEINLSIDRLVYYAGWADKYQQLFATVNPVASSHFNFSVLEPQGVVAVVAPEKSPLLGLISSIIPAITGGNTVVVLASENKALSAITFAEVLNDSDVPAGVINILTGKQKEILPHMASHMDVNAVLYCREDKGAFKDLQIASSENLKRVIHGYSENWNSMEHENPYRISDHQEVKTTWHPIENIGASGSGY